MRSPDGVRQERTGWRDEQLSLRHRKWGFNCPAVDLDFLMVEYNIGKPVGLIEYKHYRAATPNIKHATYRALLELSNAAYLPFIIAFYWPDIWAFRVTTMNDVAREQFNDGQIYTEREFVGTLYRMRRLKLTDHLVEFLRNELPSRVAA